MRRVGLFLAGLVLLAGVAVPSFAVGAHDDSSTCAFSPSGRKLGCLGTYEDTYDACGVELWRADNSRWLVAGEGNTGRAYAKPLRPGVWQILDYKRDVLGQAVTTNAKRTRWKIMNARGKFVATARGPDGAWLALVLLWAGRDCLD